MPDADKLAQSDHKSEKVQESRKGLDQVAHVTPKADAMSPQDAVSAAESKAKDAKE